MKRRNSIPKRSTATILLAAGLILFAPIAAEASPQHTTALQPDTTAPHRTRIILKDGSYQIVMSYRIVGDIVHYHSGERGGAEEHIPLAPVDFDATPRWEKQHAQPAADTDSPQQAPAIDPE